MWTANFVDVLVFCEAAFEICFFTSLSPESTKLVHFSSMYNNKDEKVKLLGCLFSSGFVPFQRE